MKSNEQKKQNSPKKKESKKKHEEKIDWHELMGSNNRGLKRKKGGALTN